MMDLVDVRRDSHEREDAIKRRPQADVAMLDHAIRRLDEPLDDNRGGWNADQPQRRAESDNSLILLS